MARWIRRFAWVVLLLAGCGRSAVPTEDTGAREAAQHFFLAIIERDWPRAHALLDGEGRKRHNSESFARLGRQYRQRLGFEPEAVHVVACEEHGDSAIAHVTLTGGRGKFREAVALHRVGTTWEVVLPANFGQGGRP